QQILAVESRGPFGHLVALAPGQDVGQGRLAGAVRTHDRVNFAGRNVQGPALEDRLAVDLGMQVGNRQHQLVSSARYCAMTSRASSIVSTDFCLRGAAVGVEAVRLSAARTLIEPPSK